MRNTFFALLVVNLVLLLWGLIFGSASAAPQWERKPFKYGQLEELTLLKEIASPAVSQQSAQPVTRDEPALPMKDGKLLCDMVGPFEDKPQAELFLERLTAIDIAAQIKDLELPAGLRYQVYLAPEASRKAALRKLTELQAKQVDSYIIPKGELANGISLGLFSREPLAQDHLSKMRSIGLNPEMKVIERTYWETWVMLEPGEAGEMSTLSWERVLEGMNDLERRQNFCLDVASQDNIH